LNFEKSKEGLIQMYRNTKEQAKLWLNINILFGLVKFIIIKC
jgi:hypothetical protein